VAELESKLIVAEGAKLEAEENIQELRKELQLSKEEIKKKVN